METHLVRLFRERWKAVEEIERQELRAMSPEDHWRQINQLACFAMSTGLWRDDDDGEMEVFRRWAMLKRKIGPSFAKIGSERRK